MVINCIMAAVALTVVGDNPAGFWSKDELFKTPSFRECPDAESRYPGIKALFVSGKGPKDTAAEFFCYYGTPEGKAPEDGWPGVVLVHGGGGTAYPQYVKKWTSLGFAVIAPDWYNCRPAPGLTNAPPTQTNIKRIPLDGGRRQDHVANVANMVLAHSLIRSFPEVNASRTVFVGLSWGSWYGGCVAAVDDRFRGAVEIYCGDYRPDLKGDRELVNGRFLNSAKIPMWWAVSTNDRNVTPGSSNAGFARCARLDGVTLVNDLPHSHIGFSFDSVHRMAAYYTGSGRRLPKLGKARISDGWLEAPVLDDGAGIAAVKLGYTVSTDMPEWKRQWKYAQGEMSGGKVRARLPAGTVKCYLAAYEKERSRFKDLCGTTVFVDVKPSDIVDASAMPPVAAFESGHARMEFDMQGCVASLREKKTGRELVGERTPFVSLMRTNGAACLPLGVELRGDDMLAFRFPEAGEIVLSVKPESFGWTFAVEKAAAGECAHMDVACLKPSCRTYIGATFANAFSDDASAVFVRPYDPQPEPRARSREGLLARIEPPFEFAGHKVGIAAGPRTEILGMMREMTTAADVPWSRSGGAWAIGSEDARRSYLFARMEKPVADAPYYIALAELGGFQILHFTSDWAGTLGHYKLRPKRYPEGIATMKQVTDMIHAAGLKSSIHTLSCCISPSDAWVRPVPSHDLRPDYSYTLAAAVGANATDCIEVSEKPGPKHSLVFTYSSNGNVLRIDDELMQYSAISREKPYRFSKLVRGAFGTRPAAHAAGAQVDYLHHRYTAFYPKPDSPLMDKIADALAAVYNGAGHDGLYYDGSEGIGSRYGIDAFRWNLFRKLRDLPGGHVIEASARGPNNWWFQTRTGTQDHPVFSPKRFHDRHVRDALKIRKAEFIEPQMGWWQPCQATPKCHGHFLDDMEYFASQNAGIDAAMSIQGIDKRPLPKTVLSQLTVLGWYERFRLARAFRPELLERMAVPRAEFRLRQDWRGEWLSTPVETFRHRSGTVDDRIWNVSSATARRAAVRIEALYGAGAANGGESKTLISPSDVKSMNTRSAPGMWVSATEGSDPEKGGTIVLTASNRNAEVRGSWVCATRAYKFPYRDVSPADGFGLWIKGDGSGALFNLQVKGAPEYGNGYSDHVVRLDFKGWRYVPLLLRERDAWVNEDYDWPYGWFSTVYINSARVAHLSHVAMYLVDVPKGASAKVEIAEVNTLRHVPDSTVRGVVLAVNGRKHAVPFGELRCGDYVELEEGRWTRYNEMGEPLETAKTGDSVALAAGDNHCSITAADGSMRLETTFFALGDAGPALTGRVSPEGAKYLTVEPMMPVFYAPSKGFDSVPDVVTRPGETARVVMTVEGPVKGLSIGGIRVPDLAAGAAWTNDVPSVSGTWKTSVSCTDPASASAWITFVKRYAR